MKTPNYTHWLPFSWHGIHLEIPHEWNPGKIVGDGKSGEVRLDDSRLVRLELEWKEARGDTQVTQIVDRYIEGLAKNAQKQKGQLAVERTASLPDLQVSGLEPTEYFSWQSTLRVHTLVGYSPATDRLIFLRVMAYPDENLDPVLPRILNSIQDTPADQPREWALYDLSCTIPQGYDLETYELKSGHVRLLFHKGRNLLQIDRLSLAQMILQNTSLPDWYRGFFAKDLRNIEVELCETDREHQHSITGAPKGRLRGLLQPLPFWNVRPRLYLEGRVWHDFESNKILCVQSYWKNPEEAPDIQAFADSVTAFQVEA